MIKTSLTKNNYVNTKTQVLFWFYFIRDPYGPVPTVRHACDSRINW